jgi:hypothetical protein
VRTDRARLGELAKRQGWRVRGDRRDVYPTAARPRPRSARPGEGIVLAELSSETSTRQLEELFFELTSANTEVRP